MATSNQYDAIIIGAGLGGLTAAATLAKKGKKVLVLEQHTIPGGCATVFHRKGIRCEVGLHEMEMGKYSRDIKQMIFKKLGLHKTLPLVQLPETWRLKTESIDLTIPHGYRAAIQTLEKEFPDEKTGIRVYFKKLKLLTFAYRRLPYDLSFIDFFFFPITTLPLHIYYHFKQRSVGQVLDKIIKNEKLKRVLNINIGYYHEDPYKLSWFYHAAAQAGYYNSACFIKGGSQVLSDELVKIIENNDGKVMMNCDVQKINLQGNKATGVTWYNKKQKELLQATGKHIIANCAPAIVYDTLLPKEFEDVALQKLKSSISLYSVYIIFKQKFSSLYPNNAYSTFINSDECINQPISEMRNNKNIPVQDRNFVFVDYSTIDSGLEKPNDPKSFGVLTGTSYMQEWEFPTKEDYDAQKEKLAQSLFKRLETHYPGFTEHIAFYEVSTPKTIQRYIKTPDGTAYGYAQDAFVKNGRAKRVSPTVKNLYFAGAWTFPGGGFTGAIISGYITAQNIISPIVTYTIKRTLLCILVGFLIGTAHLWIPLLWYIFFN